MLWMVWKKQRLTGKERTSYIDIEPNTSVRTGFLRQDYDYFRPGESISKRSKENHKAVYGRLMIKWELLEMLLI